MKCDYSEECSGCSLWGLEYQNQLTTKTKHLQQLAQELDYTGSIQSFQVGPVVVRDYADLQWRKNGGWGFFNNSKNQIISIEKCLLFTESLQTLFHWWRQQRLEAEKASVRLRTDDQGNWGVWLDLANLDVKKLLQEEALLTHWTSRAHVEIGQRHKVLHKVGSGWKLGEPILKPWFTTIDAHQRLFPLYGSVGTFSQVGRAVNHLLVENVLRVLNETKIKRVVELGAGSGNFTLPMASEGFQVLALEQEEQAVKGLNKSMIEFPSLATQIRIVQGNFQSVLWGEWAREESVLLLDPPRSGLGASLLREIPNSFFSYIVYVACGLTAWHQDGHRLRALGYELTQLAWVDQFPNTNHLEIISLWRSVRRRTHPTQ